MKPKIVGTGGYLPRKILSNLDLEKMVETSDEWIQQRVGISNRHIASSDETTAFMATEAAKRALDMAGLDPAEIDMILVATSTPDQMMPSTACSVQASLGCDKAFAFDLASACSGFVYGMSVVQQYFTAGTVKNVLLIGSERNSCLVDWSDRSTCVLFGDGAGAAVFTAHPEDGILATRLHSDGRALSQLYTTEHFPKDGLQNCITKPNFYMEGSKVFKAAVNMLGQVAVQTLADLGMTQADIDWLVPHQANKRIIMATAKKFNIPESKVILTLADQGNTSAASVPLALDTAIRDGRIKPGDILLLEAFGAGYSWGASIVKY